MKRRDSLDEDSSCSTSIFEEIKEAQNIDYKSLTNSHSSGAEGGSFPNWRIVSQNDYGKNSFQLTRVEDSSNCRESIREANAKTACQYWNSIYGFNGDEDSYKIDEDLITKGEESDFFI